MKTKIKRISKRTLLIILSVLMIFSTMLIGTFSANAVTFNSGDFLYFNFNAIGSTVQGNLLNDDALIDSNGTTGSYSGGSCYFTGLSGVVKVKLAKSIDFGTYNGMLFKTSNSNWYQVDIGTRPSAGQNMVIVSADGKSYTWGTYSSTVDYYVAGEKDPIGGNNFSTMNKMTKDSNGTYSITYKNVAADNYRFKVVKDADWNAGNWGADAYDGYVESGDNDKNAVVRVKALSTVTITFNPSGNSGSGKISVTITPTTIPTEPTGSGGARAEYIYKINGLTVSMASDESGTSLPEPYSIDEGEKVYFNVKVASVTRQYGEKGIPESYTGEVICRLYKMDGETPNVSTDTLVNSTMNENTASGVSFSLFDVLHDTSTYYVRVYPSADSAADELSETYTVNNATVHGEFPLTVYLDLGNVDVSKYGGDVMISVMDSNGDIKIRKLTELGNNIYNYSVNAAYYKTSNNQYYADFVFRRLLLGTYTGDAESDYDGATSIAFAETDQPDLAKCYSTGAIWYKLTDDNVESNFTVEGYTIDNSKKTTAKSEIQSISGEFESDYNRFYITNNLELENVKVFYTSDGKNYLEGGSFTYVDINQHNEKYYYFDLPIDAKKFYMIVYADSAYKTVSQRTEVVTISSKYSYKTDNAYYFNKDDSGAILSSNGYYDLKLWTEGDFPAAPELTSYTSDLYMCVGDTYSMVTSFHGATVSYGSVNSSIASVSAATYTGKGDMKATSTIRAVAKGTATFTITPVDSLKSKGEAGTVTVHVVDKAELGHLLANVEYLESNSWLSASGYDYVESLVNNIKNIYDYALELYQNSYNQTLIDNVTNELKTALNSLYAPHIENEDSIVRLSYTTANISLKADENGTVSAVQDNNTGYVKNNEDGTYTIIYAADDGSYSHSSNGTFEFKLNAFAAANSGYHFVEWVNGKNAQITDNANLTLNVPVKASDLSDNAVTYTAKFEPDTQYVNLTIKYIFKDYDSDTSGTFEYKDGYTKDSSYTTSAIQVPEDFVNGVATVDVNEQNLLKIVKEKAPVIVSSYFNYSLDEEQPIISIDEKENGFLVTAQITETMKEYSLTVNGQPCGKGGYHFQEVVTLSSTDFGFGEDDEVYWYNTNSLDGSTKPISTNSTYQFRVTEDMQLGVEANDEGLTVDGNSVITHTYAEIIYQNDTKKIGQNFYIENFFDVENPKAYNSDGTEIENAEDVTFLGAGVFYFAWNDNTNKAAKSQITDTVLENLEKYALTFATSGTEQGSSLVYENKNVGLSYSYISYAEDQKKDYKDQILRYSTTNSCYNYIFEAIMNSNSNYSKYSYHVYSFYLYSYKLNGETKYGVSLSDTHADAKVYVGNSGV